MSQTTTLAVIGGVAALASAVLGLVGHDHHEVSAPEARVSAQLERPLYVPVPLLPTPGDDGVLGPSNVAPPVAPPVVAPHAVIRPL